MDNKPISTPNRVSSGVQGLDAVLEGGFYDASSVLLRGIPGAGKTTLGTQFVAAGVRDHGEPGVIVSFETFPDHYYRDAASLGWNLREMELRGLLRVLFLRRDDLYSSFPERESMAVSRLTDAALEIGAKRLFIDGASRFWRLPLPHEQQLAVYQDFVLKAKGLGAVTMLALNTMPGAAPGSHPAEQGADFILCLDRDENVDHPDLRVLTVTRARGQNVQLGRHPFAITPEGVQLWPRILPAEIAAPHVSEQRFPCGTDELNDLLGGGFRAGSSALLAGPGGSGKTILAAAFARHAARTSGSALLIHAAPLPGAKQECPGLVTCQIHSSRVAHPLEYLYRVRCLTAQCKPSVVVLDGVPLLTQPAAAARTWHHDVVQPLAAWAAENEAVLLVSTHLGAPNPITALAAEAALQDFETILLTGFADADNPESKQVRVVKARGGCKDHNPRPLKSSEA
ncbi:hypothetical protein CVU37_09550 [candidate division BRC1 bacterium HGW-BRC1-1]|jgi:circadian clock protein KaiC|nr:MAG: hypothetical protein CVU37_09550 [candidate division BRC1 bacterium HGW-BRC1-1]